MRLSTDGCSWTGHAHVANANDMSGLSRYATCTKCGRMSGLKVRSRCAKLDDELPRGLPLRPSAIMPRSLTPRHPFGLQSHLIVTVVSIYEGLPVIRQRLPKSCASPRVPAAPIRLGNTACCPDRVASANQPCSANQQPRGQCTLDVTAVHYDHPQSSRTKGLHGSRTAVQRAWQHGVATPATVLQW